MSDRASGSGHGGTILLVEDDPVLQDVTRSLLEDIGFSVRTADNGRDAIVLLSQEPQLVAIVVDLLMPVMNGWEFLSWADHHLGPVPVIVTSASPDCAEAKRRHRCVTECIKKPYSIDDLEHAVARHTG